jgi:hypothetical protein
MGVDSNSIDALPPVRANLNYLVPAPGKPARYTYEPPPGVPLDTATYQPHLTRIRDARPIAARLSLDREGFALVDHRSPVGNFYVSALQPDEALLLKGYDSAEDGRARFAPHSAFEDPNSPGGVPPRKSIELRAFVFYPD